ncbi:PLP-dependent aminotransferase family protein [Agreia bicolorata]|uniref:GntR family transcriptional regulator n=1 Tax=Agreia bicolorata TaxID=110935 RepID=A0ABR5CEI8_9MICO|nr:PLP-dependent aminotransferase family protein [Agreia bicolorata]KJC64007.1 GntR family transcriptional regulator [Agreia bicolorata]
MSLTTASDTIAPNRVTSLVKHLTDPQGFGDATLRNRRHDAIELLGGIPDPSALPTAELIESTRRVLGAPASGTDSLQYSRTAGLDPLRQWIAAREGVPVERILITNGGFHGISLSLAAIVDRGDLVAVDNPIFPLFLRGLELSQGQVLPIAVHNDGLDVEALSAELARGARPVAVYTVPDFHNPSQGTLPTAARTELVRLAEHYGFTVLADNPYRELRFRGEEQSFDVFNQSSHVVHINTFTKTLGPGLRLGWVVVPEHLVDAFVKLRSRQDSHSSTFVQSVVGDLLNAQPAFFDDNLATANALYRRRADLLADSLELHAPGEFQISQPEGGFFLWPRLLDDKIDAERLAHDASDEGVEYQRGSFFTSGEGSDADRHLRLAYGNVSEELLDEAAARIGRALARQRG